MRARTGQVVALGRGVCHGGTAGLDDVHQRRQALLLADRVEHVQLGDQVSPPTQHRPALGARPHLDDDAFEALDRTVALRDLLGEERLDLGEPLPS